jgi:hypothetical protein
VTGPVEPEPLGPADPGEPGDSAGLDGSAEPAEPVDVDEAGVDEPDDGAPRRYPSTIGGALYLALLVGAVTAIGIIVGGDWRVGVRVLAACLGAAAALRLVLPQRDAGMLAVRHRLVDVVMLAAVAGLLWWLAGSIPDQPAV